MRNGFRVCRSVFCSSTASFPGDGYDRIETDRTSGVAAARDGADPGRPARRIVRVGMDGAVGRRAGFEQAVAAAGEITSGFIATEGLEFADGFAAGDAIIAFGADAVFFDTDRMALGFYRYASERGVTIPEKVAVAGFDDDAAGAFAISGADHGRAPRRRNVARAVEKILSPAEGAPELVVYPARLVRRESISS